VLLGRRPAPSALGSVRAAPAMLRAGAPLCAVTLTNQAMTSADLLIVGAVVGVAAAGDYYLASQVAVAALVVANAAGQSALARLASLAGDPAAFAVRLGAELRLVSALGLILAVGLALAGPAVATRAFGPEHAMVGPLLWSLLPWLALQHPTTLLQGALAAARRERAVLRGNLVMLAALVPALALAALAGSLWAFPLARGLAEAARLAALVTSQRQGR
jgi:O-antigen/teichoic acid export membrane protein